MQKTSLNVQGLELPDRAFVIGGAAQLGSAVKRIDHEQRAFLAHRHGLVIEQAGHDGLVLEVAHGDADLVVVDGHGADGLAIGLDGGASTGLITSLLLTSSLVGGGVQCQSNDVCAGVVNRSQIRRVTTGVLHHLLCPSC